MVEFHRIYVDSRFRAIFSASSTDFKFELVDDLYIPPNTKCYIDDITIPISYYSIESNINDRIYFRRVSSVADGLNNISDDILTIPSGNYNIESLRDAIQLLLTAKYGAGKFTVESSIRTNTFTIKILTSENFIVVTEDELKSGNILNGSWSGDSYDKTNTKSFSNNMKNVSGPSVFSKNGTPFASGFVDFLGVHTLYLHSNISSYNNQNYTGKCNIIKKICVTNSFGYLQVDNAVMESEYINVSSRIFKTLDFALTDVYGNVIDLHRGEISFTLRFTA